MTSRIFFFGSPKALLKGAQKRGQEDMSKNTMKLPKNHVRKLREDLLMSRAELARRAGLSALTLDRVESGLPCRMDTKRKIILALGLQLRDKKQVFED